MAAWLEPSYIMPVSIYIVDACKSSEKRTHDPGRCQGVLFPLGFFRVAALPAGRLRQCGGPFTA